jgi:hypothetical protein
MILWRRLQKLTIGRRADGTPLQVYATGEGTYRSSRYTRTTTLRLMPEQIQVMAGSNPERYRELLARYGYLN